MQLPDHIVDHILGFVYHDKNSFSNTSTLIKDLKTDMYEFIEHYVWIIENKLHSRKTYHLSFANLFFVYRKFCLFKKYYSNNRLDNRLIFHTFMMYL